MFVYSTAPQVFHHPPGTVLAGALGGYLPGKLRIVEVAHLLQALKHLLHGLFAVAVPDQALPDLLDGTRPVAQVTESPALGEGSLAFEPDLF